MINLSLLRQAQEDFVIASLGIRTCNTSKYTPLSPHRHSSQPEVTLSHPEPVEGCRRVSKGVEGWLLHRIHVNNQPEILQGMILKKSLNLLLKRVFDFSE